MAAKTMKIAVSITIEVDREQSDLIYGHGDSPAEVRAEVRDYALNQLNASAAADGGAILSVVDNHR